MPILCHLSRRFVYLQVGITSESECLCTNLCIYLYRLVVPPPSESLRRVDCLVSGVLMAVVAEIVYEWLIEPRFLRDLSSVCHWPFWWWCSWWNHPLMPQWLWCPLLRGLTLQYGFLTAFYPPMGVRIGVASLDNTCTRIHLKVDCCLGLLPLH